MKLVACWRADKPWTWILPGVIGLKCQWWMICDPLDSLQMWASLGLLSLSLKICILHRLERILICACRVEWVPSICEWILLIPFALFVVVVALMSWVEGSFRDFWTLASESNFTTPQLNFYAKINDHGIRLDNTGHPVASRVALDLPYWTLDDALGTVPPDPWPSKHGHQTGPFFLSSIFVLHNRSYTTMLLSIKNK